ncbi:hypothetical protein KUG47_15500 [Falsochrobactrum sp. TDYN1]|uniref:Uncharacterized protein n=1 Tax=Falsochrobactrum tianjinense TaxID=2706015 RepID=A0A949PQ08_9HYPH|nr:hypothetical protein [Falsochrobactrum sp. TDYN1]MBV2144903.1 hypothetical protein [Falsochrobactrum sp. TDYN1]
MGQIVVEEGLKSQALEPLYAAYTEWLLSLVSETGPDWLNSLLDEDIHKQSRPDQPFTRGYGARLRSISRIHLNALYRQVVVCDGELN